jgi:hypothetical protein
LDPTGKEYDGFYHADLYVSRSPEDIRCRPLTDLMLHQGAAEVGSTDPMSG